MSMFSWYSVLYIEHNKINSIKISRLLLLFDKKLKRFTYHALFEENGGISLLILLYAVEGCYMFFFKRSEFHFLMKKRLVQNV
jgi:hypothetical protein